MIRQNKKVCHLLVTLSATESSCQELECVSVSVCRPLFTHWQAAGSLSHNMNMRLCCSLQLREWTLVRSRCQERRVYVCVLWDEQDVKITRGIMCTCWVECHSLPFALSLYYSSSLLRAGADEPCAAGQLWTSDLAQNWHDPLGPFNTPPHTDNGAQSNSAQKPVWVLSLVALLVTDTLLIRRNFLYCKSLNTWNGWRLRMPLTAKRFFLSLGVTPCVWAKFMCL